MKDSPTPALESDSTQHSETPTLTLMSEATRNKRKQTCRRMKALAELYMMAGLIGEALPLYQETLEEAKAIQDACFHASALEGITVAMILGVWWSYKMNEEVSALSEVELILTGSAPYLLPHRAVHGTSRGPDSSSCTKPGSCHAFIAQGVRSQHGCLLRVVRERS